jgi:hypothetical protein
MNDVFVSLQTYDDFADDLSSKEDPLETVDDDDLSGVSFSSVRNS